MENKHKKRYTSNHVIRKMQIKIIGYKTINILNWPKSKTLTTPNAGNNVEQQELSVLLIK